MAKFEIEFEVEELRIAGLKIKVKGDREDARTAQILGQRLTGLLQPPVSDIIDVKPERDQQPLLPGLEAGTESSSGKKKQTRRKRPANGQASVSTNGGDQAQALAWKHDSSKWGSPQQKWSTAMKSLWLLFVATNETDIKEMGSAMITETFNKHFRQSGPILAHNVARDLGRLKKKTPPQVSEDTTQNPSAWFLTEAGIREAQKLVTEARGGAIN